MADINQIGRCVILINNIVENACLTSRCWTLVRVCPSRMSLQRKRSGQTSGGSSWLQVQWQVLFLARVQPLWTDSRSSCRLAMLSTETDGTIDVLLGN